MYRSFLLFCILLYLESIVVNGNEINVNEYDVRTHDNQKVELSTSTYDLKKISGMKKNNTCLGSFREVFEFKLCSKSENQVDEIRCKLMNETADYFCSLSDTFNIENLTKSVPDLCEKKFDLNKSIVVPSSIAFLLDGWNTLKHYGCKDICKKEQQYFKVCVFVFNYYTGLLPASKIEPNSISNGSRINTLAPQDDPPANTKNVPEDTKKEEINKTGVGSSNTMQGSEYKRNGEPDSSDKKTDFQKENPSNDDNEQESKNDITPVKVSKIDNEGDSHALSYFALVSGICIIFYLMMYNKKKILALMIEGRRRNVKRRSNGAAYSKLDCNLEEALASGPSTSTSNTLLY